MKPYIEYNNKKYEFEANFTMKKEYEKEIQNRYNEMYKNGKITKDNLTDIEELNNFFKKYGNDITEDVIKNNPEIREKLFRNKELIDNIYISDINEKFCFRMLKEKYGINEETWESMNEEYYEEYCNNISELEMLYSMICDKVFTQSEKKETPKKKPIWENW